jgi:hypothetical protein
MFIKLLSGYRCAVVEINDVQAGRFETVLAKGLERHRCLETSRFTLLRRKFVAIRGEKRCFYNQAIWLDCTVLGTS